MNGSEFGSVLHDVLAGADVPDAARRWASGDLAPGLAAWRRLADLGVTALAVPEKQGGLGASPLDLVVACEELGHHAVPGPAAESPTAGRDVSAAKVACAEAAYRAARAALQVHGAIGYTAEHELSRFLLQVRALVPAWGSQAEHRARILRELG